MKLNSLKRRENMHQTPYGNRRQLAERCHYVWLRYLDHLRTGTPCCDVMIWEIGETVNVRPASTGLDESSRQFVKPFPIYFKLSGLPALQRQLARRHRDDPAEAERRQSELDRELAESMQAGILAGLKNKTVAKRYSKFEADPLTVVITQRDDGLHASEFELVWQNEQGPSLALIKRRAKAQRGKPLPSGERSPSTWEARAAAIKEENRQWRAAVKEQVAKRESNVRQKAPAVRAKLAAAWGKQEKERQQELAKLQAKRGATVSRSSSKTLLLALDDGNQLDRVLSADCGLDRMAKTIVAYPWSSYDTYDNRFWEYTYQLWDPVVTAAKAKNTAALWRKLNRPQKILLAMLSFLGETDNGGVWQFLFNEPALALAALEAMEELQLTTLARDYRRVLSELLGKGNTIAAIRQQANDASLTSQARWQAFARGYPELASTKTIEKYVYTAKWQKQLHKRLADYIEARLPYFMKPQS
ncbi:MAG: DUF4375 domain-containing protein [Planctomycetales bacterium]|nr:DUF4375 domain-containing protein [Planctomycetales bacterium]